jgi:hypothetical protein
MFKMKDEFHLLIECPTYKRLRNRLFVSANDIDMCFNQNSPEQKNFWLMTNENVVVIQKLGEFSVERFRQRKQAQNQLQL